MRNCRTLVAALLLATASAPATAQTYYGGYDIGPDYGAMLEEKMREFDAFGAQLAEYERRVTEQAMADPVCQRLYQGHQQQGGQLPYPNFAYLCWATRHFEPGGIADFQRSEQENWKKEHLALIDLRQMEAIRGEAQNTLNNTIANDKSKLGSVVAGSATYFDPFSGGTVILPQFSAPNISHWDTATQRYYTMDAGGTYLVWNNGAWHPIQIQPRR
jgi:hypothetical protein